MNDGARCLSFDLHYSAGCFFMIVEILRPAVSPISCMFVWAPVLDDGSGLRCAVAHPRVVA